MVLTDPIADMLSRIRNAISVNRKVVNVPYSKLKETLANKLKESNFIDDVKVEGEGVSKSLIITINAEGTNARITSLERVSKPGRRAYAKANEIPRVKNGRGIIFVSTSQGVLTGREAAKRRLGGELIFRVY